MIVGENENVFFVTFFKDRYLAQYSMKTSQILSMYLRDTDGGSVSQNFDLEPSFYFIKQKV